jgi:nucleotide-binding universal stress UspA family protein
MQKPIQNIICSVDFSSPSHLVVRYGVVMAQRLGAPLTLFHAVHDPQDGVHSTTLFERGGDLEQLTGEARQQMAELMVNLQLDWNAEVRFGDPVEQMVAFADRVPQSLVVAASHGVSGFRRLFIGTVVERLSRALSCPLLVVKPGPTQDERVFDGFNAILVSCDDHGSWTQLASMLSLLRAEKPFRVHLAHTLESPVDMGKLDEETAPYNQAQQKMQARLEGTLKNQGKKFFPSADTLSVAVAPGVPQEMVLFSAEEMGADLIVVGARHSRKVGRWISGSTTETLLRKSPCDVLVLPETKIREDRGRNR